MEFIDLKAQQLRIRDDIEIKIKKVLEHGQYINGPEVKELEEVLADYVGINYAVGVDSVTSALLIPLMAFDAGPGDEVFTSAFSFIASAEVISLLGTKPIFIDVDADTCNINVQELEKTVEKVLDQRKLIPRGIIPVDLFGQAADYERII